MNDIEIIKLAKQGDEKAIDELYDKYRKNILVIAKKYFLNDGNNDDIVQEGMMGFLKAINTFDAEKGNFYSYLIKLVEQQIINAIKKSNALKNSPLNERFNLNSQGELELTDNEKVLGIPNDSLTPESTILMEENHKELTDLMFDKLSEFERKVMQLYLSGFSYNDIIEKLNVSYKSVDNALNRVKTKLHNFNKGD